MAFRKLRPVRPPVKKTRVNWRVGEAKQKLDDAITEFHLRRPTRNESASGRGPQTAWSAMANKVAAEYDIPRTVFRKRVFGDSGFKVFVFYSKGRFEKQANVLKEGYELLGRLEQSKI